jgi:hypothetical protein
VTLGRSRADTLSIRPIFMVTIALLLAGCASAPATSSDAAETLRTVAVPVATSVAAPVGTPRRITPAPTSTPEADAFPLAEPGPYVVGMRSLPTIPDPARDDRPVSIRIWYPAVQPPAPAASEAPAGAPGFVADAPPDPSGGPYPVILSSSKVATIFAPYLVSHGFAWVSVDGLDSYPRMSLEMIDQPLDILFALDHVASSPPDGVEGLLDTEHAGVTGYSFDGYNALAMSGARIDSAYYLSNCPIKDAVTAKLLGSLSAFDCRPSLTWDEYVERAGDAIAPGEDGLWQPLSDERIRAAMPLAGEGWWLFGERGLAAVTRPVLMLAATQDTLYPENAAIFDHLGTPDKAFISFVGPDHMMIYDQRMVERMAHFATAFFGYHLAGREELARYVSKDFVAGHDDLAWGTVPPR